MFLPEALTCTVARRCARTPCRQRRGWLSDNGFVELLTVMRSAERWDGCDATCVMNGSGACMTTNSLCTEAAGIGGGDEHIKEQLLPLDDNKIWQMDDNKHWMVGAGERLPCGEHAAAAPSSS